MEDYSSKYKIGVLSALDRAKTSTDCCRPGLVPSNLRYAYYIVSTRN